jgi:hypothetical protein
MKKQDVKIGGTYLAKVTDKVVPVRLDKENPHGGWDATNIATNKKVRIKSAQRLRGPAPAAGSGKPKPASKPEAAVDTTPKPDALTAVVESEIVKNDHGDRVEVWYFSVREGQVEHWADDATFDTDAKARKAADAWMARYRKANDTGRRKLLGWKPAATTGNTATTVEPPAPARTPKAKPAKAPKDAVAITPKRVSLIDAAAQVLARSKEPLNTRQLVEQVTQQGLWSSPNGKTPSATLYAAILRECQSKGDASRFTKVERGLFTLAKGA